MTVTKIYYTFKILTIIERKYLIRENKSSKSVCVIILIMLDYPVLPTLFDSQETFEKWKNNTQMKAVCVASKWKDSGCYMDKKWILSISLEYSFMLRLGKVTIKAKFVSIMIGKFPNIKAEIENVTIFYELWGVV